MEMSKVLSKTLRRLRPSHGGYYPPNKFRRVMLMEYLAMVFLVLVAATAYISITKN